MARQDITTKDHASVEEIARALEELIDKGENLDAPENRELAIAVFEILEKNSGVDAYETKDWNKVLQALKEIGKSEEEAKIKETEEEAATSRVPTGKIRELLAEYERLVEREGLGREE